MSPTSRFHCNCFSFLVEKKMSKGGGEDEVATEEEPAPPKHFKFPAHQNHMLSLAKMCQENKEYTDCIIQCDSGVKLKAHRLVLGAASPFMKLVFSEVPASLPEATVMVPGVKISVVQSLIDFLYSGEMTVSRSDTADLQLLIDTLQIDPELVSVQENDDDENDDEEPSSSSSSPTEEQKTDNPPPSKDELKTKRKASDQEGETSSSNSEKNGEVKKRKLADDDNDDDS